MPKKNDNNPTEKKGEVSAAPISSLRFALGIFFIVLGTLIFIAITAFAVTGGADRSIFDLSIVELISNPDIEVRNPMGKFGAWISDLLVTNGIGLMALTIPYLLIVLGVWVLRLRHFSLRKQFAFCLALAIWGSITLGFIFYRFSGQFYLLMGGMHGYYCARWLTSALGSLGTIVILALISFFFFATHFESLRTSLMSFLQRIKLPGISLPTIEMNDGSQKPEPMPEAPTQTENKPNDGIDIEINSTSSKTDNEDKPDDVETDEPKDNETDNNKHEKLGGVEIVRLRNDEPGIEIPDSPIDIEVDKPAAEDTDDELRHIGLDEKYDPTLDLSTYEFPTLELLNDYGGDNDNVSNDELNSNIEKIIHTLENFQIKIDKIKATIGPTVTLYEIVPAPGIKISKIQGLQDDIAMSLAALGIRIIAPIPGKGAIGIEVPNAKPKTVSMRSVIRSSAFQDSDAELPIAIGKTISGDTFVFDLAKTPHLLVAGATGQGKSVGMNAIITSLLYRKHPSQVKFVMIDPKMVEFSIYKVLEKHYLAKMPDEDDAVITDIDKVKNTLLSLTIEMDDRYRLLEAAKVRQVKEYNEKFVNRVLNPEKGHRYMPYIIVIIDEFADLIMTAGKEVEMPIARIAQKARAVGIHMILATQRPSVNIITGVIKANFPSRIAFKVASGTDSKTILDQPGAQGLIGRGDMLILLAGKMTPTRVQCAFVDTPEVEKITQFISQQRGYASAYELPECIIGEGGQPVDPTDEPGKFDSKIKEVATMVVKSQIGSTSNIQRVFGVGYNRAGKLMDQLERMGIVSPVNGSKPREVYVQTELDLQPIFERFGL